MRVALGLKARTGRAIVVAIGASPELRVLDRAELRLLPKGDFAPYHAAKELPPAAAQQSLDRSIASAHRLAEKGIRGAVRNLEKARHLVCGCGVLVGPGMPSWSTKEILAVHVRMHQAEGELFRQVLLAAARACGYIPMTLREKSALDDASAMLGVSRADLEALLAALGKAAGPPWSRDQKEATAVAIVALSSAKA